jgi:hypothetical protein
MHNQRVIFTSAAANYLPKARLLFRSLRKFHPDARLVLALPDVVPDWLDLEQEPFDAVIDLTRLDIPDVRRWAFQHQIVELATAIKPFFIKHLLGSPDVGSVIYFDPDMVLFSPVDDIFARLEQENLVLTPHQTKPEEGMQAIVDNEICSLKHGIYNLGFIGVRNTEEGRRFAAWWAERTYHFCRADIAAGLFTDQRWMDFAPVFFEGVGIIKSSRHNLATWNVTTRVVEGSVAEGIRVDGEPLGFYHFTGFDSGDHQIMANKNAPGNRAIADLIGWYQRALEADRDHRAEHTAWAFGRYADGSAIPLCHRYIYRERKDLQQVFADPFEAADSESYLRWLQHQGPMEYPDVIGQDGRCIQAERQGDTSLSHGCKWWLKRLVTPKTCMPTAAYVIRRLTEGLR